MCLHYALSSHALTCALPKDDAENVLMLLDGRKTAMLVHQDSYCYDSLYV